MTSQTQANREMTPDRIWSEFSPSRRQMLRDILAHDGISEHSASLAFKRGDITWGVKRKLIDRRPYRQWTEFFVTDVGRAAIAKAEGREP